MGTQVQILPGSLRHLMRRVLNISSEETQYKIMTDAQDPIDDELLKLAKQAVEEGRKHHWGMNNIATRLKKLAADSDINNAELDSKKFNAALEQASYIKDFKPGYSPRKDYPVEQENDW